MTFHATSLGQIVLARRMEAEITRQKGQPPRWPRPKIFRSPADAASFVRRVATRSGTAGEWTHAADIVAMTWGHYCWPQQAEKAAIMLAGILAQDEASAEFEAGGHRIAMTKLPDEMRIELAIGEETLSNRFLLAGDCYVPVPWDDRGEDD